jgi:hypothetical protein
MVVNLRDLLIINNMKLSFSDFWDGVDPNSNFFTELFKTLYDIEIIPLSDKTDVLIYSCFGSQHNNTNRSKTKKIFYTGENKRPNYSECDYSFTFDFEDYNGKNIRVPLWLIQIDFFNKKSYGNPQYVIPLEYLTITEKNPFFKKKKSHFCAIVNNHLANRRDELIERLNPLKSIHGYGHAFKNNTWFYGEDKKINLLSNYRFNICFENGSHPGYYTEKIIHAKAAGCIPLYNTDKRCEEDFNKKSFLNLSDFSSINEYIEKILEIENTPSLYEQIKNEPLFIDSNYPLNFLTNIKDQIKLIL